MSSLMIDNTTLLREVDEVVPIFVNSSVLPLKTRKSLSGMAANNKVKSGR